jgi:hypothetical protein
LERCAAFFDHRLDFDGTKWPLGTLSKSESECGIVQSLSVKGH